MKILMVVHGFAPECSGGTESYVLRLATELRGLRHEVEIVCGSHQGAPEVTIETARVEGFRVHRIHRSGLYVDDWDKSYAPEIDPALDRVLASFKPDLAHVHHWIRLSRHLIEAFHDRGVPAVATLHDLWTTCPLAFRIRKGAFCERPVGAASCHDCAKRAEFADDAENAEGLELFREDFKNELRLARRLLVPSNAHKLEIVKHRPEAAGKIRVTPFAPASNLRAAPSARAASADGKLRVRHWGHLSALKGSDLLLDAAARLPERIRRRLDLKLMGTVVYPEERAVLERLAAAAGATVTGAPFGPADLEREPADLAVFPSRASESYSFVLDEAFQLGLPAIVPARGALGERVMGAGATFRPDDPDDLARLLAAAVEDPSLVARWRAAIPPLRTFATHAAAVVDLYREVLASKAPLETTPPALRARRDRFRSRQVESRNRRLEFLSGDVKNLASDVERASATMAQMDRSHREKDVLIEGLRGESARLASAFETAKRETADAARRLEETTALERRLKTDLEALEGRLSQARADRAGVGSRVAETTAALADASARLKAAELREGLLRVEIETALAEAGIRAAEAAAERSDVGARAQAAETRASLLADAIEGARAEAAAGRTAAEARAADLSTRFAALQTERDEARRELDRSRDDVDSLRSGLATLESSLATKAAALEDAEKRLIEMRRTLAERDLTIAAFESNLEEHMDKVNDLSLSLDDLRRAHDTDRERTESAVARLNGVRAVLAGAAAPGEAPTEPHPLFAALREVEQDAAETLAAAGAERVRLVESLARRDAALADLARAVEDLERRLSTAAKPAAAPPAAPSPKPLADRLKHVLFGDDKRPRVAGRLKVLTVIHQFLPKHVAGTEIYAHLLARELMKLGAGVSILACEAHHDRAPFERLRRTYDGIPVHEVVQNYRWESFEATYDCPQMDEIFEAVLDEEKPDVIHVHHLHYFSANFLSIAARRGVTIVYTLHDYMLLCARDGQLRRADGELCLTADPEKCADCIGHHRLDSTHVPARRRRHRTAHEGLSADARLVIARVRAGLAPLDDGRDASPRGLYVAAAAERLEAWKHAIRHVAVFISPSRFLKDLYVESGLIPASKIVVSDNGQDLARFANAPPRVRGPRLRLGYVGTIAEHKGLHVLIEAMNSFVDDDRVECAIHGAPDAFIEYTERLVALNKNPRTRLAGPFKNEDVGRVLSEIDVLVIPSLWWENSPLTVHEAALSKLPVIASDQGGLAEYVEEGVNGLRFYLGDAEDLRRKIAWFLEDRARLDAFRYDRVPMTPIADDARRMLERYRALVGVPGRATT
jgi:glycosyltransferase involved in cell wall biosynthesis